MNYFCGILTSQTSIVVLSLYSVGIVLPLAFVGLHWGWNHLIAAARRFGVMVLPLLIGIRFSCLGYPLSVAAYDETKLALVIFSTIFSLGSWILAFAFTTPFTIPIKYDRNDRPKPQLPLKLTTSHKIASVVLVTQLALFSLMLMASFVESLDTVTKVLACINGVLSAWPMACRSA